MLIGRCAWHRHYHGYPRLQGIASWRGLGLRFTDDGPEVDPRAAQRLPADWEGLEATLAWRGRSHPLKVARP